jgi:predicted nucleotidyltransferase
MNELALLAPEVGVNERTLRRAVNEGTLKGNRLSPRKLRLSPSEKAYVRSHWDLLSRLREGLRTEPNVRFALLFGSTARGDDTEESDVDLLVEMRDRQPTVDLAVKLEERLGHQVDVVALEDAHPLLLAEAAREGRVLVDRKDRWQSFSADRARFERRARARYRSQKRRALAGIERLLSES